MQLSDFDYKLPRELIAQYPLRERDSARLLVLDRGRGSIKHCFFSQISDYLGRGDLLVLNDTKVLPVRLKGRRISGGKAEVLLLKPKQGLFFEALIKPGRIKLGERIIFDSGSVSAIATAKNEISFHASSVEEVYNLGRMPLPPYIKREPEELDNLYYQTVYAREEGAVASPTAGLHFTEGLLENIQAHGVDVAYITLHVGLGTFRPVRSEDIREHKMEAEYFRVPQITADLITKARSAGRRIIAVGTTVLRALESCFAGAKEGWTDLFVYPGYKFSAIDCLLTNFHLPRTTLFMLVCAFAGEAQVKKVYQEAIQQKYRFYSYGDAMFII